MQSSIKDIQQFEETSFDLLMQKRIHKVLLVCSAYDAFMLEEDGRIDEQIFNEYVSLSLRYPPRFIQVSSSGKAFEVLEEENIDLIISMLSIEDIDPFQFAKKVKIEYPDIPIVALTPFSREVSLKLEKEDTSAIDFIFCWLGNADILLAIIKLIEDRMNMDNDVLDQGVQMIILVEDSIRFYSSYLPIIYRIIFEQSQKFQSEGLNEHQKMLRKRGRPKILLARTWEEAIESYKKYRGNLLSLITDVSFVKGGKRDKEAGIQLVEKLRENDPYLPIMIQSSDTGNEQRAARLNASFIHKHSKRLTIELRDFLTNYLGFGDFCFINPHTNEIIDRVSDLKSFQEKLLVIPDESLYYHFERDDVSKWLKARALFGIARVVKDLKIQQFGNINETKMHLYHIMARFRYFKGRGVISKFESDSYDEYLAFARIGEGSIGGKARGLAFLANIVFRYKAELQFKETLITIPRTVVLSTEVFDKFMTGNDLFRIALSDIEDDKILDAFIEAEFPHEHLNELKTFLNFVSQPLAIRSSSVLEDSHYQPFAGIYTTYMIPNLANKDLMLENLINAIKCVYASVYYKESKAYMVSTSSVIDEERMAVVLQEVCGQQYENRFYPAISGVARSVNFYPIEPEKSDEGIVNIALGLGKYIVEGGTSIRFSPKFPKKVLQLSTPDMAIRETQKHFWALNLSKEFFSPSSDDSINLLKIDIQKTDDEIVSRLASVYDYNYNVIRDGSFHEGMKIMTFASVLKYDLFPMADILNKILDICHKEMNNPIEIEYAVDFKVKGADTPYQFNLLQIRPILQEQEKLEEDISEVKKDKLVFSSNKTLGNGILKEIKDIVYVRMQNFDPANNQKIVQSINEVNGRMQKENRNYILAGPGRWGSSDPWLGIPVRWAQIAMARVIIELGTEDYNVEPSQGTHFFQNLTSLRVGYFTLNRGSKEGHADLEYLDKLDAVYEDEFIRCVRSEKSFVAKIDGQKSKGIVLKA